VTRGKGRAAREDWAARVLRQYGLTPDQVAEMWGLQDGRCAICGADLTVKRWAIDHDHRTKVVRGLVCFYCNWKVLGIMSRAGRARAISACVYLGWLVRRADGTYVDVRSDLLLERILPP
jgi:DNA-directed RNA polymerase subunit RPC12/RpoP